jgi:colanic acid/amylovoran biosynthesis glycosyltransferase
MSPVSSHRVSRRMRIAYIVGAFPHVSETFIVNQIVGVAEQGHEVDVYATCEGGTDLIPPSVERSGLMRRVYAIHTASGRLRAVAQIAGRMLAVGVRAPLIAWRVFRIARRDGWSGSPRLLYAACTLSKLGYKEYDVIHAQFGPYGSLALNLIEVGALRGAVVTSFRGYDAGKHLSAVPASYQKLFREGALFLPVSETLRKRLIRAGCEPIKVRVHHSGIRCAPLPLVKKIRLAGEPTRLIVVARLVEKKGIRYAIDAIARVLASNREVHCEIVGDGPLHVALACQIGDLDLGAHVRLIGWKSHDEVLEMIGAAHVLIAPSVTADDGDAEGIPNAVKEAMAMGLPVVATSHGGIPELVQDGVCGLLVPERDAPALADKIAYLIDHPDVWERMGAAGRRKVESQFDLEKLNDELIELYEEATSRSVAPLPLMPQALTEH